MTTYALITATPAKRARLAPKRRRPALSGEFLGFCITSAETAPQWGLWRGGVFIPLRPEDYGYRVVWDAERRIVGLEPMR